MTKRRTHNPQSPDDETVKRANASGNMGPGHAGGGYGHQHFSPDRTGGTYGGHEATGGKLGSDPLAERHVERGQQHMSGAYGSPAYGRVGPGDGRVPHDPSQRNLSAGVEGDHIIKDHPDEGESINAQIGSGTSDTQIGRGSENERDAPGISTDKGSDDSRE